MWKNLGLVLIVVALAACASAPYQPEGYGGGYSETRLDVNAFRVSYRGNASVSAAKAEDLAMLRASHLTLMNGYTYFVISDRSADVKRNSTTMPGQSTTTGRVSTFGNQAHVSSTTRSSSDEPFTFEKHRSTLTIVCFKDRPEGNSLVVNAAMVAQSIAQRYGINPADIAPMQAAN